MGTPSTRIATTCSVLLILLCLQAMPARRCWNHARSSRQLNVHGFVWWAWQTEARNSISSRKAARRSFNRPCHDIRARLKAADGGQWHLIYAGGNSGANPDSIVQAKTSANQKLKQSIYLGNRSICIYSRFEVAEYDHDPVRPVWKSSQRQTTESGNNFVRLEWSRRNAPRDARSDFRGWNFDRLLLGFMVKHRLTGVNPPQDTKYVTSKPIAKRFWVRKRLQNWRNWVRSLRFQADFFYEAEILLPIG